MSLLGLFMCKIGRHDWTWTWHGQDRARFCRTCPAHEVMVVAYGSVWLVKPERRSEETKA